jgi:hypothetical protein
MVPLSHSFDFCAYTLLPTSGSSMAIRIENLVKGVWLIMWSSVGSSFRPQGAAKYPRLHNNRRERVQPIQTDLIRNPITSHRKSLHLLQFSAMSYVVT